jgi:hypothetical protein
MKSPKKILLFLVLLVIGIIIGGRLYVRHLAVEYGKHTSRAVAVVGHESFANPFKLRRFFADPSMTGPADRISLLSFLGGHYDECLKELQAGMLYLSEQAGEPAAKRFRRSPPAFQYLRLDLSDHSDQGVGNAAIHFIESYLSQL